MPKTYVSVTVEDFTAQQWQQVFKEDIEDKKRQQFMLTGIPPRRFAVKYIDNGIKLFLDNKMKLYNIVSK